MGGESGGRLKRVKGGPQVALTGGGKKKDQKVGTKGVKATQGGEGGESTVDLVMIQRGGSGGGSSRGKEKKNFGMIKKKFEITP